MMNKERTRVEDYLIHALASTKDPKAAKAIANKLGDFFNHEAAASALRQMGPVAEQAVLDVAPSNNPDTSLAAIVLLGELGTPNSYEVLRQAMRSSNSEVREAAKESLRAVRERNREGT
jgi:HEAT repeat protein